MTITSIATLLQEAAGNHAVAMWGRSTEGFASDPSEGGLIFVMTRMQIQMEYYPRWWVPRMPATRTCTAAAAG
jgi:fatty acyl-ACP thioesterase A